jgi:hypothetical protein
MGRRCATRRIFLLGVQIFFDRADIRNDLPFSNSRRVSGRFVAALPQYEGLKVLQD